MDVSSTHDQAIDYAPCRYGGSRLWFRGPRRALRSPYVACLGGSNVYGRFVAEPWTQLLETRCAAPVVNLGVENAGIDAYLNDPGALSTAAQAKVVLIQLTGVHNTSNRFYATHPRRNDRFLKASQALISLYPEMDFTEVHFTRHLLARLNGICPDRFAMIAREARMAWQARIKTVIAQMKGKVILLWFAPSGLGDDADCEIGEEPFLTRQTVLGLLPHVHQLIEVVPPEWRGPEESLDVPPFELTRAAHLPGPAAHRSVAQTLAPVVRDLLT